MLYSNCKTTVRLSYPPAADAGFETLHDTYTYLMTKAYKFNHFASNAKLSNFLVMLPSRRSARKLRLHFFICTHTYGSEDDGGTHGQLRPGAVKRRTRRASWLANCKPRWLCSLAWATRLRYLRSPREMERLSKACWADCADGWAAESGVAVVVATGW